MTENIEPIRGWMLDLAAMLDQKLPGFAGGYLRASHARRQVIAAFCAKTGLQGTLSAREAAFLLEARHRDILELAYGASPEGFRGALSRSGAQPHDVRFYGLLFRLLSCGERRKAKTIHQLGSLTFPALRIINLLPRDVCSPLVVEALDDVETARCAVRVIELLIEHGVNRDDLTRAILSVQDGIQLGRLWNRWVMRCRLPKQPIPATAAYRPIETADELRRLALRYRNCATRYLIGALDGHDAFGEFVGTAGELGMVAHLHLRPDGWEVEGLYLKGNMRPPADRMRRAYEFFAAAGVRSGEHTSDRPSPWSSLRRLTAPLRWDFDIR